MCSSHMVHIRLSGNPCTIRAVQDQTSKEPRKSDLHRFLIFIYIRSEENADSTKNVDSTKMRIQLKMRMRVCPRNAHALQIGIVDGGKF